MKQFRLTFLAATLSFATGWLATPAHADLLTVSGSTSGVFSNDNNNYQHLSFTGSTFGPTSGDTITLGTLDLGNGTDTYTGAFDLTVTFSDPANTSGNPITGTLSGSVQGNSGGITISFTNPTLFTFPTGSFDLSVANVTDNGGNETLTGTLSNETDPPAVPEPVSIVLLGTCVATIGFARRKQWI